jgi:hypothetical protein
VIAIEEPAIAFAVAAHDGPGLEVRVNFGIFAGRQATPAEIDRLGERLLGELRSVTVVAEERHEFGRGVEASVLQVRIEVADDELPPDGPDRDALRERVLAHAEAWAAACIHERHTDLTDEIV